MVAKPISELPNDLMKKIVKAGLLTQGYIQENTPVAASIPSDPPYSLGHTGGRLQGSIAFEETTHGFRIYTNMDYAEYVEAGTTDHIVMPKEKKMLKFFHAGAWRFSRGHSVRGIQGRLMFHGGAVEFQKYLKDLLA